MQLRDLLEKGWWDYEQVGVWNKKDLGKSNDFKNMAVIWVAFFLA